MDKTYKNSNVIEHYSFKYGDYYILMDVNTLDVVILDEIENSIVKTFEQNNVEEELNKLKKQFKNAVVKEKISELIKNGILKNTGENCATKTRANHDVNIINSIDLLISEGCNLACKYCYVKNGQYQGKSDLMSVDIGKKAVDFLIKKSGDRSDLFLCFFGGEPLLNFEVLKEVVAYALEKGKVNNKMFHFTMTTNGILLTKEIVGFIAKHGFKVTISIDGDKHSHNINRPLPRGGDSYTTLSKNLNNLNRYNLSYAARTTVTSYTKDRIADNFEHLLLLGFKRIHIENAYSPKSSVFISETGDVRETKHQFSLITEKIIEKIESGTVTAIESSPLPVGKIINKRKSTRSCLAGLGYVTVDVHGDIYLCHRLVGEKDFLMGNVVSGHYKTEIPEKIVTELDVDSREPCRKCWARYICGGGCHAINYVFNKDISKAPELYCEHRKHTIECALAVYASAEQKAREI